MASHPALNVQVDSFDGLCTDLDSHGDGLLATVAFSARNAPALSLGESAKLRFMGGGLVGSVDTEAQSVQRTEDPAQRCYSFTIANVPKSMLMLLANRRKSGRRVVRSEKAIRLLDVPRGVLPSVTLHDVSASGLSIIVEPAVEKALADRVQVRVEVSLPGEAPMVLTATIRHRRMHRSQILYGLQFEEHAEAFALAQRRLRAQM